MNRKTVLILMLALLAVPVLGQNDRTTFTGTAVIYGSGFNTRTITRTFTLRLNRETSASDVSRLINTLQERGQNGLLDELDDQDVGSFALGSQVARDVNAAHVERVGDRLRVRAVFARWLGFGELRGGYRSVDYPFSYVEIFVDPRTGKGEGTFIPAARIRYRNRDGQPQVEIEDFGTFPGRLMGVQMRGRPLA
jgi:hypothetical protein